MDKEKMEALADVQHDIWSSWMKYLLFIISKENQAGDYFIPKGSVKRWQRQINTPYKDLSEKEKESDRNQVRKFEHLIEKPKD